MLGHRLRDRLVRAFVGHHKLRRFWLILYLSSGKNLELRAEISEFPNAPVLLRAVIRQNCLVWGLLIAADKAALSCAFSVRALLN